MTYADLRPETWTYYEMKTSGRTPGSKGTPVRVWIYIIEKIDDRTAKVMEYIMRSSRDIAVEWSTVDREWLKYSMTIKAGSIALRYATKIPTHDMLKCVFTAAVNT